MQVGQKLKDQLQQDIRTYWSFGNDKAVINGIIMKGRHVILPVVLKAAGTKPTPHQSHGDREHKTLGM